jgi:hypothetical protein
MEVFITRPRFSAIETWEISRLESITKYIRDCKDFPEITLTDHPDQAEMIIMLESNRIQTRNYIKEIRKEEVLYLKPYRVYTINYSDKPLGLLPGLYSSLETNNFNTEFYLSWPHLDCNNQHVDSYSSSKNPDTNSYLFSFAGACSHPFRKELFSAFNKKTTDYKVVEVDRYFNHTEMEKMRYIRDILKSKYVLCPRGFTSYSHRIIETIVLGRVPVIIADDWIPFSIPETDYYVQVPESDVSNIPEILKKLEPSYNSMIENVRTVFKKYFTESQRYSIAVTKLIELHRKTNGSLNDSNSLLNWLSKKK